MEEKKLSEKMPRKRPPIYLGLVHHPVLNKKGDEITTSVTNLDVHDISRLSRTFGFEKFFVITPIKPQQEIIGRVVSHWKDRKTKRVHEDRVSVGVFPNSLSCGRGPAEGTEAFARNRARIRAPPASGASTTPRSR